MNIEITGVAAEEAAKSLLAIDGIEGSYETLEETNKAEVLTTIATVREDSAYQPATELPPFRERFVSQKPCYMVNTSI